VVDRQATSDSSRSRLSRRAHLILGLIFLGALLLRGAYLWGQAENNPLFDHPMMDAKQHHEWAQRIASGEGMEPRPFYRAPAYYYLLGALYRVFGPSVAAARLAGCLLGAATCYLIARLGIALAGWRVGVLAGLVAAVYWPFIYFDAELLSTGLELFLDVALLLLLLRAGRGGSLPLFLLSGLVWGLSAITRPNILAFAPAIVAWFWITGPAGRRAAHTLRATALVCVGAALIVLPVTARNRVVGGEAILISSNGGITFYHANNPSANGVAAVVPGARPGLVGALADMRQIPERELGRALTDGELSDYWYAKALAWIRSDPAAWGKLLLLKLWLFWSPFEIPNNQPIWPCARQAWVSALFWIGFPVVAPLALGGMLLVRRQWRTWFLPAAFLVIYTATVVAFLVPARYRLPVVPVLILFASAGVLQVAQAVRARGFRTIAGYVAIGGAVALVQATSLGGLERFRVTTEAKWQRNLGVYYATPPPAGPSDWARAAEHFRESLQLDPDHPQSRLGLGHALVQLSEFDQAAKEYSLAVRQHPRNAEARLHYGWTLALLRRNQEAIEQYQAAIALQPAYAEAHQNLGCLLGTLGRNAEAMRHLRTALAIQPDLARARSCLDDLLKGPGV